MAGGRDSLQVPDAAVASAIDTLRALLEQHGERLPETLWLGALGMLELAAQEAREGIGGRWRSRPRIELRRLLRAIEQAVELAELAAELGAAHSELEDALMAPARAAAAAAAAERRREGTREAERVRLANAAARREGRPLTPRERWPWLYADDATGDDV